VLVPCFPGNFANTTFLGSGMSGITCLQCPAGQYQDMFASIDCFPCPSLGKKQANGSMSIEECRGMFVSRYILFYFLLLSVRLWLWIWKIYLILSLHSENSKAFNWFALLVINKDINLNYRYFKIVDILSICVTLNIISISTLVLKNEMWKRFVNINEGNRVVLLVIVSLQWNSGLNQTNICSWSFWLFVLVDQYSWQSLCKCFITKWEGAVCLQQDVFIFWNLSKPSFANIC